MDRLSSDRLYDISRGDGEGVSSDELFALCDEVRERRTTDLTAEEVEAIAGLVESISCDQTGSRVDVDGVAAALALAPIDKIIKAHTK